ncbi:MAG: retroviral-like aspartic protease family protein [Dissulfurispiraceae bacterium]
MSRRLVFGVPLFYLLVLSLAHAGFDEGKAAYNKGDYSTAYNEFKELAVQGNAEAQYNLGRMYIEGQGVPRNYAEATKWYRKAAEQGHAGAQHDLGMMYNSGQGVPKDDAEAARWYRKAADQGDVGAQYNLGVMYREGDGVPQDDAEAVKWFCMAAEQGNAYAQNNLGRMYERGHSLPQDYAKAVKWYRKAAEQGNAYAQYNLGMMYHEGQGLPKDDAEALSWFSKAAKQGVAEAQAILRAWSTTEVPLENPGSGVYELPVKINGVLTLKFILDSGASEVNIPADVALKLLRTGTITYRDFLPGKSYALADGSILKSSRLNIRELDVGGITICQVPASLGPANGALLLGQSFLGRLESWSMDNKRHVLVIGGGTSASLRDE